MFEIVKREDVNVMIDRRAAEFTEEIRLMAERAIDEIKIRAGWSTASINRSRGQRRRFARLKEEA